MDAVSPRTDRLTSEKQRDSAVALSKSDPAQAHLIAAAITDPWYRAQSLAWVARFSDVKTIEITREAYAAALQCNDQYQRTAVRAWEIAALAEVGAFFEATNALTDALVTIPSVVPLASRAEALFLLAQAASMIGAPHRDKICQTILECCATASHWRCKRAMRDAIALRNGRKPPREFFW